MMGSNTILDSLDKFIRKYYKNRMIKGIIYAVTIHLSLFLIIVLFEHFGYFGTVVRAILFWAYLLVSLTVVVAYIIIPLAKMFRLGKVISYEEAARIVGNHFPEIKDKLLNLIQLHQQEGDFSDDLLGAAIAQKTAQLKPIPFQQAVDIRSSYKYIKYAAIPLVVIILLLIFSPTLLTQPSHRIVHYTTQFERPAPFVFVIDNSSLQVPQQEDFDLRISIHGDVVPAEAFINIDGNRYRLQKQDDSHFLYQFKTVQHSCNFQFEAAGVTSPRFTLKVFPKPTVIAFQTVLSYPVYTHKPSEILYNEGNMVVPQGTLIKWNFHTQSVDTLYFLVDEDIKKLTPDANGHISYTLSAMWSLSYGFTLSNRFAPISDTLTFAITTIDDAVPTIAVVEMKDSTLDGRLFFEGRIKDDYGFSRLEFKRIKINTKDTFAKDSVSQPIAITQESMQEFSYAISLDELGLMPGDKLVYYFEVWDNDGVHGPKSATSQQFELSVPTEQELDNILNRNSEEARQSAQRSISELKKMQEDINELMHRLVDKKELNWQDNRDLQELAKKQKQVKNMLQQMQQQLKENNRLEDRYKDQSDKLMEKQQELDRLMNEVLTEEMKKMMQQIDEMMKEMDKKKVQEELEQLRMSNEDLEKQLDQNIELMKRLEVEKKVEDAIQKAEKLSEKQYDLSNKTENANSDENREKLLREQRDLSQQYDQLKQELRQIQKEYQEIDKDLNFKLDKELMESIGRDQEESENSLQNKKSREASKKQKNAAEKLDQLSEQLAESQQDLEQDDLAEDVDLIRQLLKNLVHLSQDQESLISRVGNTYIQDPKYQTIIACQNRIKSDFRGVEDSLRAIAKRQVQVASVINRNLSEVNNSLARSLNGLIDMNQSFYGSYKNVQASTSMQYAMTSFNNLALVMAESLDQMQNQMRQNNQKKKSGSCKNTGKKKNGNCSNPGKGKFSTKSINEMQKELNKQMEALKKQLDKQGEKGKSNSRKKLGDKGNSQVSEEFARMAAQQEMIRRMMQEHGQELKQGGGNNSKLIKEVDQMIKQMEQTETDLVNRVINQQTIRRQQQIVTRMLEHEKAEMEREKDEHRQSREGEDIYHQLTPSNFEKIKKLQDKNTDLFRSVSPTLSPYYKSKVDDYFYKF